LLVVLTLAALATIAANAQAAALKYVSDKCLPTFVTLNADVTDEGIDYFASAFGHVIDDGFVGEGDVAEIEIQFLQYVRIEVLEITGGGVVFAYQLDGLIQREGWIEAPFGEYAFDWGMNLGLIPRWQENDVQVWAWLGTFFSAYFGQSTIEGYPFLMWGTVTEDGQVVWEEMPAVFGLWVKYEGVGKLLKNLHAKLNLYQQGEYYEQYLTLPAGIYSIRYNLP